MQFSSPFLRYGYVEYVAPFECHIICEVSKAKIVNKIIKWITLGIQYLFPLLRIPESVTYMINWKYGFVLSNFLCHDNALD